MNKIKTWWKDVWAKRAFKKSLTDLQKSDPRVKFFKVCQVLERKSLEHKDPELQYSLRKKKGRSGLYIHASRLASSLHGVTIGPPENWTKSNLNKVVTYANKYHKERIESYEKFKKRSDFSIDLENFKNRIKEKWGKLWSTV